MDKVFLRTAFNYDRNKASDETGLDCSVEPSMTQQSFASECDINTIVKRFGVTGELPTGVRMPTFGDFTGVKDFATAMNAIAQARESFDAMPAEWRARFHNDPQEFLEFCSDDKNRQEAIKMGLVSAQVNDLAPSGVVVPPASPAAPGGPPAPPSTVNN